MVATDPVTRHGIERELLERIAALEAEVEQLRTEIQCLDDHLSAHLY